MKRFFSILLITLLLLQVAAPCSAFADGDWSTDPIELEFGDKLTKNNCTITLSAESFAYTGKAITPQVSVQFINDIGSTAALRAGSDYELRFSANTNPGKALVTVTGLGEFSGSVSKAFTIVPQKMQALKAIGINYCAIKTSFVRVPGATGYQLCIAPSGTTDFKYAVSDGKKAFLFSDLKDNTKYKLRIRAYVEIEGKRYYGAYSDYITVKTKSAVGAPAITGSRRLNRPQIGWKAVKGATKYILYRADSLGGKYTRISTTNKTTFSDKTAKPRKTYYYVARAYTVKGGKAYVSVLSNKVKIKV